MSVTILAVGKKHEPWVQDGIERYEKRLRKPFDVTWKMLPHSTREGDAARAEESRRLMDRLLPGDTVVLLDERGVALDSPGVAKLLQGSFDVGRSVVFVIGGAYGVDGELRARADTMWSLSPLVFPHQLVRLIAVEQIYRAQEIRAGRGYHHA